LEAGQGKNLFSPVLKISRQFPFILLVEICLRDGKVSGREMIKFLDVKFVMSRKEMLSQGFTVYDRN
jgi:hypothetical protein